MTFHFWILKVNDSNFHSYCEDVTSLASNYKVRVMWKRVKSKALLCPFMVENHFSEVI